MTGGPVVVIGIGNPYRHDDGIGPAVADAIDGLHLPGVRVAMSDGEPIGLLAAWEDTSLAIVVDAIRHEPPCPGRIHRLTVSQLGSDAGEPAATASACRTRSGSALRCAASPVTS